MSIYNVPQNEWAQFCQDFSDRHKGEPITIESLSSNEEDAEVERNIVAQDCPLHSLRIERGGAEELLVFLGRDRDAGPEFVVSPAQIRLEQPDTEEAGRLHIDTTDGQTILLYVPVPVLPGILNGA